MKPKVEVRRNERGQALVLIVLAIVAMFGFAALAVDLGRVYAERRRAQNAADAAAYAAAYAGSKMLNDTDRLTAAVDAAKSQLKLNDFVDPNDINTARTDSEQTVDVQVNYQPMTEGEGGYYKVNIDARVDQVFSQFVYRGPLRISVEAVVETVNSGGIFEGDALHATDPNTCKGLWFTGAGDVSISGGNAYSDSTAGAASCGAKNVNCSSGVKGGSGNITLDDGHTISVGGAFNTNGNKGQITTIPGLTDQSKIVQTCQKPKPLPTLPAPNCGPEQILPDFNKVAKNDVVFLDPGTYKSGISITTADSNIQLRPGLYCLGGSLSINGGIFTGNGVMFYMYGGGIDIGGNTTVTLTSPDNTVPPTEPYPSWGTDDGKDYQWGGMLFYMPDTNTSQIHLSGSSGSMYSGTIFAPGEPPNTGASKCVLEGNSTTVNKKPSELNENITFSSSMICNTIEVAGKATVNINYDAGKNFKFPPVMSLAK